MANVRLEWAANPAAEQVIAYKVWEYVNGNMSYPNLLGETVNTFYEIPNHSSGIFAWSVSAMNLAGDGPKSDPVLGPAIPTKPATPTVVITV